MKNNNSQRNNNLTTRQVTGFILIETIVAIGILMLAIPAALTVASKSVFLASYSKDQVIATYLAQEGIEIIRNHRDENMLRGVPWLVGITSSACPATTPGKGCRVDYGPSDENPLIETCTTGCSTVLNKDTVYGSYSYQPVSATVVPSKFSRVIQIEDVTGNDEIRVTSIVTYAAGGVNKTIALTRNLTRWVQ